MQELARECDVVVNCAGLRGGPLAGDADSFPVRGHVNRVRAPWIKCAYFSDGEYYVLPNHDTVVLGGTGQVGDADLSPRPADRDRIWQGCLRMVPSLAKVCERPAVHVMRVALEGRAGCGHVGSAALFDFVEYPNG